MFFLTITSKLHNYSQCLVSNSKRLCYKLAAYYYYIILELMTDVGYVLVESGKSALNYTLISYAINQLC